MKVVILGAGRRGMRLARHLIEEKAEVVFLDSSSARCGEISDKLDCLAVCGSATNIEDLKKAGVSDADAVIAVTDSDETNLVASGIIASRFPEVGKTIAAIRSVTYLGLEDEEGSVLGITHIVNPDQEAAERIAGILTTGVFRDFAYFEGTEVYMFSRRISPNGPFTDKTLIQVKREIPGKYVFTGIKKRGRVSTPSGDTIIKAGDEVTIIVDDSESPELFKKLSEQARSRIRKIVIVGATRIAGYVLRKLDKEKKKNVTLIERNYEICKAFASEFPEALVVNGSITDEDLWDQERLENADAVISVTENDELNIIVTSYAKRLGVPRAIALISTNISYVHLAEALDIDSVIYTADAAVDAITKSLRSDDIKSLHTTFDGELEVFEYTIPPGFKYVDKHLKDVNLKGKVIIGGVKRPGEKTLIPDGNYSFKEGDTLIIASTHAAYAFVQDLFK